MTPATLLECSTGSNDDLADLCLQDDCQSVSANAVWTNGVRVTSEIVPTWRISLSEPPNGRNSIPRYN